MRRVFVRELQDVADAHDQVARVLPKITELLNGDGLRDAVSYLEDRTENARRALERVLEEHGQGGKTTCKPVRAMAQEATRGAKGTSASLEQDLLTSTNLQKMIHDLIASLGSLRAWSELVEDEDAILLFRHLTDDMKRMDRRLTEIAEEELGSRADGRTQGGDRGHGTNGRGVDGSRPIR